VALRQGPPIGSSGEYLTIGNRLIDPEQWSDIENGAFREDYCRQTLYIQQENRFVFV
jgi:hypothetical protein